MVDGQCRRIAAAFVLMASAAAAQTLNHVSELPTIHHDVAEVDLTFTVMDGRGRFVTGLAQDNFAILDDRLPPASIRRFQPLTDLPLRLCMLIDASDSIAQHMKFQQEVAISFFRQTMRPGLDRACVIRFSLDAELVQEFTDDLPKLEETIRMVNAGGRTAAWDAVRLGSEIMARQLPGREARRVLLLITDGGDNASAATFEKALTAALRSEVVVEVVETTPREPENKVLQRLAHDTGGHLWMGHNARQLAAAMRKIEQSLRSAYFLAYEPAGTLKPGRFRRIEMKLRHRRAKIAHRSGYFVPESHRTRP